MKSKNIKGVDATMRDTTDVFGLDESKLQLEMEKIRSSNEYSTPRETKNSLKLVLLNVERGKHLDEIEAYLKYHPSLKNADVIFFNELDDGMARTGNIDITAELSKRLSMNYIFGVEFFELTKGNIKEESEDSDQQNTKGLHGNAIMSRYELLEPVLLRLPVAYDWFYDKQKRLGGRIAIFAKIRVNNQLIGLVCTHLENRTSPKSREEQMKFILKQAKEHFKTMPIIIAGDMNTNTCDGTKDEEFINLYENRQSQTDRMYSPEKYEPIFKLVEGDGFDYKSANVKGKSTRRKPILKRGNLELNLDWFFVRGLSCTEAAVVKTIFSVNELECQSKIDADGKEGMEITDHNAISVKCMLEP